LRGEEEKQGWEEEQGSIDGDGNPSLSVCKQVLAGEMSKAQAFSEFLTTWDSSHDLTVTEEEFVE